MKRILTFITTLSLLTVSAFLLASCETMASVTKVSAKVLGEAGVLSGSTVEAIDKSMDDVENSKISFTLEEEYYIGRSVAASILSKYKVYGNKNATAYVSNIMNTLVIASNANEMFNGYHIAILNTDEINAFATSGGHILVTRGLMKCTENEDQLAAVIAHELAHISKNHAIQSISSSRKKDAWKSLGLAAAMTTADAVQNSKGNDSNIKTSDQLAEVTKSFSDIIGDSIDTLINSGYSKKFEFEADAYAITILNAAGYKAREMDAMLSQLEKNTPTGSTGFGKTHPSPKERKTNLNKKYGIYADVDLTPRLTRYNMAKKSF